MEKFDFNRDFMINPFPSRKEVQKFCPQCHKKMFKTKVQKGPYIGGPTYREYELFVCNDCRFEIGGKHIEQ